jgi:DMSO reductase family type II enzyme heme b subunit
MRWDDPTRNAPEPPPRKKGAGGGEPDQLYKRPTGETASFGDAAAVMAPEGWTGPDFPSLLMGDKHTPARLYYWNAARGAERLTGSGRATPTPTGDAFAYRAAHADGRWTLTLELSPLTNGHPLAFAVWDGESGDRDGMKCFSIWYALVQRERGRQP